MLKTDFIGKRRLRLAGDILALSIFVSIGGYFFFAATEGDYGAAARSEIYAKETILKSELAALNHQADALAEKTRRLSDEYLDLDLLDEEIRSVLGYIGPGEFLLPNDAER